MGLRGRDLFWKVALAAGTPLLVAVFWGIFMAPRAARRLAGGPHLAAEVGLYGLGALALNAAGHPALGWAFAMLSIGTALLRVVR